MSTRILIVDPSLTSRMYFAELLQENGYEARPFESFAAASRLATSDASTSLLVIDGDALSKTPPASIRDLFGDIAVIAITSDTMVPAGALAVISRLAAQDNILQTIRSVLTADTSTDGAAVLIIDDSTTFREQLREALEAAGYRVLTAESGEEGLSIASSSNIEAFVVDNVLPGIDGATVVRRLRQEVRHRRTPSLLLTASEDPAQELHALEAGADAFVRKDESTDILLARLASVLRSVGSPAATDGASHPPRRSVVLFVGADNIVNREAAQTLSAEGVSVNFAHPAQVDAERIDCIVMDVDGVGDPKSVIRQVRAANHGRGPRLLLLGQSDGRSEIVDAIALGADDYLPYSAGVEVLKARVRAQLRRAQLEEENEQTRERLMRQRMEIDAQRQIAAGRQAMAEELRLARDLAEEKATEAEDLLAQNEAVFSSMTEGLVIADLSGKLIHINESAIRIFGASSRAEVERLFADCSESCDIKTLNGEALPPEQWPLTSALRGEARAGLELAFLRLDTEYSFIGSFNAVPVCSREGKRILAALTVRDITMQKQSEELLRRTEKLAATGRLAASIAHEINNPLSSVINLLWLLQEQVKGNEQAEGFLATAQKELQRVAHITRQTLAFYRESSAATEVDVCSLATEVADVFSVKLRESELELRMEMDCSLRPVALAGEVRQVISNLISNAIDASSPGESIRIRVRPARRGNLAGVRITVADRGCGIPRQFYSEIFKPFASSKGVRGTGLGLWVTQSIVARHSGHIRFYSSTRSGASGTAFSAFFPLAPAIAQHRSDSISNLFRQVGRELLA